MSSSSSDAPNGGAVVPPPQLQTHHHRSLSAAAAAGSSATEDKLPSASSTSPPSTSHQQHHHHHHRATSDPATSTTSSASYFATATTESIVRRVEEEIVSARKASMLAKSRLHQSGSSSGNLLPAGQHGGSAAAASTGSATHPATLSGATTDAATLTQSSLITSPTAAASTITASESRRRAMMLTAAVNDVVLADSSSTTATGAGSAPTATSPHSLKSVRSGSSRMSAASASLKGSRSMNSNSYGKDDEYEPSFDLMEDILNIQETDSELQLHNQTSNLSRNTDGSYNDNVEEYNEADDDHFQHAMDVIGEEFETTPVAAGAAAAAVAAKSPRQRYPTSSGLPKAPSSQYDDDEDELVLQQQQAQQQTQQLPHRSVESINSSRSDGDGERGVKANDTDRSTTSSDRVVMEALSNGETAGLRARAILDTLKSRREHFSSTFRTGGGGVSGAGTGGSARSSPEDLGSAGGAEPRRPLDDHHEPPSLARADDFRPRGYPAASGRRHDGTHTDEADEKKDDDPSNSHLTMNHDRRSAEDNAGMDEKSTPSKLTVNTAVAAATSPPPTYASSTPTPSAMKRVSLPAPDRKKFKSRSKQAQGSASTPSPAAHAASVSTKATTTFSSTALGSPLAASPPLSSRRKTPTSGTSPSTMSPHPTPSATTTSSSSTSRRIRFRDPFPVLKPSSRPRDPLAMIAAHAVPAPVPVTHWLRPKNDLRQLIVAVMGSSIQRRAHACGALKVLTQTKKNQMLLMRTDSFLEALVFASSQDIPDQQRRGATHDDDDSDDEQVENPRQNRHRSGDDAMLAIDARTRAVSCLRNICEPKDNRGHVILYPGFKEALMYVIQDTPPETATAAGGGGDEARVIACGAFALLAKSPECRETFVATPGLVDLLARVMAGEVGADHKTDAKDASAAVSNDVNASRSGTLSQNTSYMSKQSSMSGHRGDQHVEDDDDDEEEDEDDEDEHTDASDDDHSHDSSHTSEYTSQLSDSDADDHDDDDDDDSSSARLSPKSSKRKDRARGHRPTHPPRRHRSAAKKGPGASSLPAEADELAQMSSIRQINQELRAEYMQRARSNACAALVHLSKHCAISNRLCGNKCLIQNLLTVSHEHDNPIHTKCLEILCNLSRFPANSSSLTRFPGLVDGLVHASDSTESVADDRVHALRALQNLSADSSSKTLLATEAVLSSLSAAALRSSEDEKEAAVAFLYNVSTEPGAVVSITNTKNVVATLVHLAHHPDSSPNVRLMSCDALATISLWLQTLAGTGKVPVDVPNVPLPSQKTTGWDRWD